MFRRLERRAETRRQKARRRQRNLRRRQRAQKQGIKANSVEFILDDTDYAGRAELVNQILDSGLVLNQKYAWTWLVDVDGKWKPPPMKIHKQWTSGKDMFHANKELLRFYIMTFYGYFGDVYYRKHSFKYYKRVKLVISLDSAITKKRFTQAFRDAQEGHCVLQPILAYSEKGMENAKSERGAKKWERKRNNCLKLMEKYPNGVPEDCLQEVADKTKAHIQIINFVAGLIQKKNVEPLWDVEPKVKDKKKIFKFLNTRLNHVELEQDQDGKRKIGTTFSTTPVAIPPKELLAKYYAWRSEGVQIAYNKDKKGMLLTISSKYGSYTVEDPYYEIVSEWEQSQGLDKIAFDVLENEELGAFVRDGILSCGTLDLENLAGEDVEDWTHIDQVKAFANFKKCPEYVGFCGALTDMRKCHSLEFALNTPGMWRIYKIDITNLADNDMGDVLRELNWLDEGIILTTPELRFWVKHGLRCRVIEGCWSAFDYLDLEFSEQMLNNKALPYYHTEEFNKEEDDEESESEAEEEETPEEEAYRLKREAKRKETEDKKKKKRKGISYYAKYVGQQECYQYTRRISTKKTDDNVKLYSDLAARQEKNPEFQIVVDDKEIHFEYPKNKVLYKGHFTAYIKAYQRITMMYQLAEVGIENVGRICVDGVYCHYDIEWGYETEYGFRPKKDGTFENYGSASYVMGANTKYYSFTDASARGNELLMGEDDEDCALFEDGLEPFKRSFTAPFRQLGKTVMVSGAGGTGKTTKFLQKDLGLVKPILFVSPSYLLAMSKKKEEQGIVEVGGFINVVGVKGEHDKMMYRKHISNCVIDEVSMLPEEPQPSKDGKVPHKDNRQDIEKALMDYKIRAIYCGDIGFQLPPVVGKVMDASTCETILPEYTKNYRFETEAQRKFCAELRRHIKEDYPTAVSLEYIHAELKSTVLAELVDYDPEKDVILASRHKDIELITKHFKGKVKDRWRVKHNDVRNNLYNGTILYGEKPCGSAVMTHGTTIHGVQGCTTEGRLFIVADGLTWAKQLIYTACSRARRKDQIYLLKL